MFVSLRLFAVAGGIVTACGLTALRLATRRKKTAAEHEPIARVLPMLSVPHLDRDFDYLVSAEQSDDAQPGVRVRVRFHGRLVDAFILEAEKRGTPEGVEHEREAPVRLVAERVRTLLAPGEA